MRRSMLATRGRAAPAAALATGMPPRRPRRLRWGGAAARAAGVAALAGLVVAWPRLSPSPPRLPSDRGVPVVHRDRGAVRVTRAGGAAAPAAQAGLSRRAVEERAARRRRAERRGQAERRRGAERRRQSERRRRAERRQ